jgi:hypothetical protein
MATAAMCTLAAGVEVPKSIQVFTSDPSFTMGDGPAWNADQTPADFLDGIGARLKVRWRQLYRASPAPPSSSRPVTAFALGGLVADGYLAMTAQDGQHFRNNNQDILSYCRLLGVNEKINPRLMAQGKLAEVENWSELRQQVVDGNQELCRVLREQRDEDMAVLVEIGLWMRLIDMVSTTVMVVGDEKGWPYAVGSPALLRDLKARYAQLAPSTRELPEVAPLEVDIDFLCRRWDNTDKPDKDRMDRTRAKIETMMKRFTPR